MADLNPEIFRDLQSAERLRPLFQAAGLPLRTWEAYALAFHERQLLERELARVSKGRGAPSIHPEVLERLQALRTWLDPLVEKLRPFLPAGPRSEEDQDLDEMILGFIAISSTAREIAQVWASDPVRYRAEAAQKLQIIETVVQRYRVALRTEIERAIAAPPALPAPRDFQATGTHGEVSLVWTPVPGATAYLVRRASSPAGPWTEIARPAQDVYSDTSLENFVTVHYTVAALGPGGAEGSAAGPLAATPQSPPPVPAGLEARPSNGRVDLAWTPAPGARHYRVLRAASPAGPFAVAAITTDPGHSDLDAVNGRTAYYAVAAVNPAGESPACAPVQATPVAPPPAPASLVANPRSASVSLRWMSVPGADRYRVSRRLAGAAADWIDLGTPAQAALVDATAANGQAYEYVVRALNAGGEGPPSAPVQAMPSGPPPAPTGLRVQPASGEVTLEWDPVPGAATYAVHRAPPSGEPWTLVAKPATTIYTDTGLPRGQAWLYRVSAANVGGEGPSSPPMPAAPVSPPPAPEGLEAHAANGRITLSWRPVPGAVQYVLRRAAAPAGPYSTLADVPGLTYVDRGLPNHAVVHYQLAAVNEAGESAAAGPVSAAPLAPPSAPQDVTATVGPGRVTLAWSPLPDAQRYRVMRSTTPGGPYTAIASCDAPAYADADVVNGTTYYYVVRALNTGGKGPASAQVEARPALPPGAPGPVDARAGNARVALAWPPVPGAVHYAIRRWPDDAVVATSAATSWVDAAVANGTTYRYTVVAVSAAGEGPASEPAEATPLAPPAPPTGLSAVAGNARVALTWTPPPRASSYVVRRAAGGSAAFETLGTSAAPSFTDLNVANGSTYLYRVTALNAGGEGAPAESAPAVPTAPPTAPTGLSAVAGDARVELHWTPSPRAASYVVHRRAPDGSTVVAGSPAEPRLLDPDLENGIRQVYRVVALNAGGESEPSAEVPATPLGPPAPVSGLEAAAGSGQVSLAWPASEGATSYSVRRAVSPEGPFDPVATTPRTSHLESGLANGTTYYYAVVALNPGGESAPCPAMAATPMAPPAPPASLSAAAGNGQVVLTWPSSARATGYLVRRRASEEVPLETVASPAEPGWTDPGLENGRAYRYVVVAVNRSGEGSPSPEVACTPLAPPSPPANVAAVAGSGQVLLTWDPVPGAEYYRVKRATERKGPYVTAANVAAARHLDGTVKDGTTYHYVVHAINAGGRSPHSARVQATPQQPPPAPAGLVSAPGDGRVALKWSPVAGATSYSIKRATRPGGPYQTILRTAQTSAIDATAANGTAYVYVVRAAVNAVKGAFSAEVSATPLASPPVPTDLRAVPGPGSIRLSWAPVAGATGYVVRRSCPGGFEVAGHVEGAAWEDLGLGDGAVHEYTVAAENAAGESAPSEPASATAASAPGVPTGLRAQPSSGEVALSWSPVPRADRYRVKRAASPAGPFRPIAEPAEPAYTDTGLLNDEPCIYAVSAINVHGESPDSFPAAATPTGAPAAPSGLRAVPGASKIDLAWMPMPTALRYRVMRSATPGGPYTLVGSPRDPSYTDFPLENGRPQHYVVSAVNAGGESPNSAEAAASPGSAPAPMAESAGTKTDEVPTLESIAMPQAEQIQGIDFERLLDLRRVEQLRTLFEGTAQRFEEWEVLLLVAEDVQGMRRTLESLLKLKRQKKAETFTAGTVALFEKVLRVRAQHGAFVRRLREFLRDLEAQPGTPETLEIALGFLLQAPKGRARLAQWLSDPDASRKPASAYLRMAYEIAERYRMALASTT